MRTTLTIDDDILAAAKALARVRKTSVGRVICDLARRGMKAGPAGPTRNKLQLFAVPENARPITDEDVKKLEDLE